MTVPLAPITFPVLSAIPWLHHGVTTRDTALPLGGDMSLTTGASDPGGIVANRTAWLATIDRTPESAVMSGLVHGVAVHEATDADRGRGVRTAATTLAATDGLMTSQPGLTLMMCFADCVPLLVVDRKERCIGLAHAGWRGTLTGMAAALVDRMREAFRTNPREIIAVIGPSIGPHVYVVGPEVASAFTERYPDDGLIDRDGDRLRLDLWRANACQFVCAGVPAENVQISGICTFTSGARFFSHRYALAHREYEGRFAVMLSIEEEMRCRWKRPSAPT